MGRAYEAHFKPLAKEAQKQAGGDKKSGEAKESLTASRQEPKEPIVSAAKAAQAVGMSERQYRRGKTKVNPLGHLSQSK